MYARHHSPDPLNDPTVMWTQCHVQDRERDIEQLRLAKLAHAARPRRRVCLPMLLGWLRARLPVRPRGLPAGLRPPRRAQPSTTGAAQR
jgi:hypothetical protein